jgi:hypothetical protein
LQQSLPVDPPLRVIELLWRGVRAQKVNGYPAS